ncbi:SUN domain-containing protein 2-like [Plodia interpunctella]|uniref:SUN domain-containing protein 2-like n=1 Tax=Plodia interpunctella TaxID=58824 RepID=UPI0023680A46|nr:SUN domain-containing protein 2-like [Plodia interpunctella]
MRRHSNASHLRMGPADPCDGDGCLRNLFCTFVCVTLSMILGLQMYAYLWGPTQISLEGDISDVGHVVLQLSHGLTEVNRKHERLQSEMERLSSVLPSVAAAADRAKDALEPAVRRTSALDAGDYDRQHADYALETAGARILDTGNTVEHVIHESVVSWALHTLVSVMCNECLGARAIIRPESLPGECWAFKGSRGEATIRLLGPVRVTGFTLEHIPKHIAPTREISSAPRLVQLEGLEIKRDPYPHDFGTFEYNRDGKPIQYFEVRNPTAKGFSMVRLRVHSNWGHSVYTCVYRVRVHGELAMRSAGDNPDMQVENE